MPSFFPPGIKLLKYESQILSNSRERTATLTTNPFLAGKGLLHDVICDGTTQYENIHFNPVMWLWNTQVWKKKMSQQYSLIIEFALISFFFQLLNNSGFAMQTERDLLYKSSSLRAIFGTLRELWVLSVWCLLTLQFPWWKTGRHRSCQSSVQK